MTNRILIWLVVSLASGASPVFSQYVWTPPAVIDTSAPNLDWQAYVAMAVDDSGNIGVAWGEGGSQLGTGYVVFQRSADNGNTWRRTNVTPPGYGRIVRDVAFDHNGNIWLLWSAAENEFAPFYLSLSKSTDTGLTFSTVFTAQEHGATMFFSRLAVDRENSVYMLWDDQQFRLTRFRQGDVAQRFDTDIPNDTLSVAYLPSLVVDGNYNVYCLWEGFYFGPELFAFVFCSVSNDTGRTFSFTSLVDTGKGNHWEPSGGVDSSGLVFVANTTARPPSSNSEIRITKSSNGGQSFDEPMTLDDVGSNVQPQLLTDVNGGVSVAWSANDGLRFRRSTDGGTTFSESQLIGAGWKRIAGDDLGNIYVGYDNLRVYFTRTNVLVSVPPISEAPEAFQLHQNYPNPFNSSTRVAFSSSRMALVSLQVYDLLGQEVEILFRDEIQAGRYEVLWDASGLSTGIYFLQMKVGMNIVATRKLLVLR